MPSPFFDPTRRRGRWDLLKDFDIGGLQLCDLTCHLVLTSSELLDGLLCGCKSLLRRLSYYICGHIRKAQDQ
jgi:hypothetical protein